MLLSLVLGYCSAEFVCTGALKKKILLSKFPRFSNYSHLPIVYPFKHFANSIAINMIFSYKKNLIFLNINENLNNQ